MHIAEGAHLKVLEDRLGLLMTGLGDVTAEPLRFVGIRLRPHAEQPSTQVRYGTIGRALHRFESGCCDDL